MEHEHFIDGNVTLVNKHLCFQPLDPTLARYGDHSLGTCIGIIRCPILPLISCIGLYRENAIAIESEANDSFGGRNVYYVTMQITLPIPECTRNERNFHCDVLHIAPDRVVILVLDEAIAVIQTSR